MSRLPRLGPRGEGWVVLQLGALGLIALAARFDAPAANVDAAARTLLDVGGFASLGVAAMLIGSGALALRNSDALSVLPRPIEGGGLVASGPYRFVRHPIYAGLILGGIAFSLLRLSLPTLLATAFLFVVLDLKRRREEVWLTSRYPGYAAYRARTKALVPYVY